MKKTASYWLILITLACIASLLAACGAAPALPAVGTPVAPAQQNPLVTEAQPSASAIILAATTEVATTVAADPTQTPEPSPTPAPLRFAVIGDYGEGNQAEQEVADLVKSC